MFGTNLELWQKSSYRLFWRTDHNVLSSNTVQLPIPRPPTMLPGRWCGRQIEGQSSRSMMTTGGRTVAVST
ncbi:hypothetical protein M404DRAFT_996084 [Pisolithus tinctorius Marx 270]|uniref:Uncharacterized protein n=1 Tax=Pisolithus tinctorius Marx 270 TaxID=870435 RepID=A0A0C3PNX1_PISTI|nr:hypothetical protein M404DRAFT_996084 [Pisolithus tinctorius Marx 270]